MSLSFEDELRLSYDHDITMSGIDEERFYYDVALFTSQVADLGAQRDGAASGAADAGARASGDDMSVDDRLIGIVSMNSRIRRRVLRSWTRDLVRLVTSAPGAHAPLRAYWREQLLLQQSYYESCRRQRLRGGDLRRALTLPALSVESAAARTATSSESDSVLLGLQSLFILLDSLSASAAEPSAGVIASGAEAARTRIAALLIDHMRRLRPFSLMPSTTGDIDAFESFISDALRAMSPAQRADACEALMALALARGWARHIVPAIKMLFEQCVAGNDALKLDARVADSADALGHNSLSVPLPLLKARALLFTASTALVFGGDASASDDAQPGDANATADAAKADAKRLASLVSIGADGAFVYAVHSSFGVAKIGTGLRGTVRGHLYRCAEWAPSGVFAVPASTKFNSVSLVCIGGAARLLCVGVARRESPESGANVSVHLAVLCAQSLDKLCADRTDALVQLNDVPSVCTAARVASDGRTLALITSSGDADEVRLYDLQPLRSVSMSRDAPSIHLKVARRLKLNAAKATHELPGEPRARNGSNGGSARLASHCYACGSFFTDGQYLVYLGPPQSTAGSNVLMLSIFSLRTGLLVGDSTPEAPMHDLASDSLVAACYDRTHHCIWTLRTNPHSISMFRSWAPPMVYAADEADVELRLQFADHSAEDALARVGVGARTVSPPSSVSSPLSGTLGAVVRFMAMLDRLARGHPGNGTFSHLPRSIGADSNVLAYSRERGINRAPLTCAIDAHPTSFRALLDLIQRARQVATSDDPSVDRRTLLYIQCAALRLLKTTLVEVLIVEPDDVNTLIGGDTRESMSALLRDLCTTEGVDANVASAAGAAYTVGFTVFFSHVEEQLAEVRRLVELRDSREATRSLLDNVLAHLSTLSFYTIDYLATTELPPVYGVHEGVTCDSCGRHPLVGARYKCVTCGDFDFCSRCFLTVEHRHKRFYRFDRSRSLSAMVSSPCAAEPTIDLLYGDVDSQRSADAAPNAEADESNAAAASQPTVKPATIDAVALERIKTLLSTLLRLCERDFEATVARVEADATPSSEVPRVTACTRLLLALQRDLFGDMCSSRDALLQAYTRLLLGSVKRSVGLCTTAATLRAAQHSYVGLLLGPFLTALQAANVIGSLKSCVDEFVGVFECVDGALGKVLGAAAVNEIAEKRSASADDGSMLLESAHPLSATIVKNGVDHEQCVRLSGARSLLLSFDTRSCVPRQCVARITVSGGGNGEEVRQWSGGEKLPSEVLAFDGEAVVFKLEHVVADDEQRKESSEADEGADAPILTWGVALTVRGDYVQPRLPSFDSYWLDTEAKLSSICVRLVGDLLGRVPSSMEKSVSAWLDAPFFEGGVDESAAVDEFTAKLVDGTDARCVDFLSFVDSLVSSRAPPMSALAAKSIGRLQRTLVAALLKHLGLLDELAADYARDARCTVGERARTSVPKRDVLSLIASLSRQLAQWSLNRAQVMKQWLTLVEEAASCQRVATSVGGDASLLAAFESNDEQVAILCTLVGVANDPLDTKATFDRLLERFSADVSATLAGNALPDAYELAVTPLVERAHFLLCAHVSTVDTVPAVDAPNPAVSDEDARAVLKQSTPELSVSDGADNRSLLTASMSPAVLVDESEPAEDGSAPASGGADERSSSLQRRVAALRTWLQTVRQSRMLQATQRSASNPLQAVLAYMQSDVPLDDFRSVMRRRATRAQNRATAFRTYERLLRSCSYALPRCELLSALNDVVKPGDHYWSNLRTAGTTLMDEVRDAFASLFAAVVSVLTDHGADASSRLLALSICGVQYSPVDATMLVDSKLIEHLRELANLDEVSPRVPSETETGVRIVSNVHAERTREHKQRALATAAWRSIRILAALTCAWPASSMHAAPASASVSLRRQVSSVMHDELTRLFALLGVSSESASSVREVNERALARWDRLFELLSFYTVLDQSPHTPSLSAANLRSTVSLCADAPPRVRLLALRVLARSLPSQYDLEKPAIVDALLGQLGALLQWRRAHDEAEAEVDESKERVDATGDAAVAEWASMVEDEKLSDNASALYQLVLHSWPENLRNATGLLAGPGGEKSAKSTRAEALRMCREVAVLDRSVLLRAPKAVCVEMAQAFSRLGGIVSVSKAEFTDQMGSPNLRSGVGGVAWLRAGAANQLAAEYVVVLRNLLKARTGDADWSLTLRRSIQSALKSVQRDATPDAAALLHASCAVLGGFVEGVHAGGLVALRGEDRSRPASGGASAGLHHGVGGGAASTSGGGAHLVVVDVVCDESEALLVDCFDPELRLHRCATSQLVPMSVSPLLGDDFQLNESMLPCFAAFLPSSDASEQQCDGVRWLRRAGLSEESSQLVQSVVIRSLCRLVSHADAHVLLQRDRNVLERLVRLGAACRPSSRLAPLEASLVRAAAALRNAETRPSTLLGRVKSMRDALPFFVGSKAARSLPTALSRRSPVAQSLIFYGDNATTVEFRGTRRRPNEASLGGMPDGGGGPPQRFAEMFVCAEACIDERVDEYYFEVTVMHMDADSSIVSVGLSPYGETAWSRGSLRFQANAKKASFGDNKKRIVEDYGGPYRSGQTVGCGWSRSRREVFFTLDGENLGVAFSNVTLGANACGVVPAVGLGHNVRVSVNFGARPFKYALMMPPERMGSGAAATPVLSEEELERRRAKRAEQLAEERAAEAKRREERRLAEQRWKREEAEPLVAMGYPEKKAMKALELTGHQGAEVAVMFLLENPDFEEDDDEEEEDEDVDEDDEEDGDVDDEEVSGDEAKEDQAEGINSAPNRSGADGQAQSEQPASAAAAPSVGPPPPPPMFDPFTAPLGPGRKAAQPPSEGASGTSSAKVASRDAADRVAQYDTNESSSFVLRDPYSFADTVSSESSPKSSLLAAWEEQVIPGLRLFMEADRGYFTPMEIDDFVLQIREQLEQGNESAAKLIVLQIVGAAGHSMRFPDIGEAGGGDNAAVGGGGRAKRGGETGKPVELIQVGKRVQIRTEASLRAALSSALLSASASASSKGASWALSSLGANTSVLGGGGGGGTGVVADGTMGVVDPWWCSPLMDETYGAVGVVERIDWSTEAALVSFEDAEHGKFVQWWYRFNYLEEPVADRRAADATPLSGATASEPEHGASASAVADSPQDGDVAELAMECVRLNARRAALRALIGIVDARGDEPQARLTTLSTALDLFGAECLQLAPAGGQRRHAGSLTRRLEAAFLAALRATDDTDESVSVAAAADLVCDECVRRLESFRAFQSQHSGVLSTESPPSPLPLRIGADGSSCMSVLFKRSTYLPSTGKFMIAVYADRACRSLLARYDAKSTFLPLFVPASECFLCVEGSGNGIGNVKVSAAVSPAHPDLSVALWLLALLCNHVPAEVLGAATVSRLILSLLDCVLSSANPSLFRESMHYVLATMLRRWSHLLAREDTASDAEVAAVSAKQLHERLAPLQTELDALHQSTSDAARMPSTYEHSLIELMVARRRCLSNASAASGTSSEPESSDLRPRVDAPLLTTGSPLTVDAEKSEAKTTTVDDRATKEDNTDVAAGRAEEKPATAATASEAAVVDTAASDASGEYDTEDGSEELRLAMAASLGVTVDELNAMRASADAVQQAPASAPPALQSSAPIAVTEPQSVASPSDEVLGESIGTVVARELGWNEAGSPAGANNSANASASVNFASPSTPETSSAVPQAPPPPPTKAELRKMELPPKLVPPSTPVWLQSIFNTFADLDALSGGARDVASTPPMSRVASVSMSLQQMENGGGGGHALLSLMGPRLQTTVSGSAAVDACRERVFAAYRDLYTQEAEAMRSDLRCVVGLPVGATIDVKTLHAVVRDAFASTCHFGGATADESVHVCVGADGGCLGIAVVDVCDSDEVVEKVRTTLFERLVAAEFRLESKETLLIVTSSVMDDPGAYFEAKGMSASTADRNVSNAWQSYLRRQLVDVDNDNALVPAFRAHLDEIFDLFSSAVPDGGAVARDEHGNVLLTHRQLNALQLRCVGAELEFETFQYIFDHFESANVATGGDSADELTRVGLPFVGCALTRAGFRELYRKQALSDPIDTWDEMRCLGIDYRLQRRCEMFAGDALQSFQAIGDAEMRELVDYVEERYRALQLTSPLHLTWDRIGVDLPMTEFADAGASASDATVSEVARYPRLCALRLSTLRLAWRILHNLNVALAVNLALIDLRLVHQRGTLAHALAQRLHLVFHSTKMDLAFRVLDRTSLRTPPKSVMVDRIKLAARRDKDVSSATSVGAVGAAAVASRSAVVSASKQLSGASASSVNAQGGVVSSSATAASTSPSSSDLLSLNSARLTKALSLSVFGAAMQQLGNVDSVLLRPVRPGGSEPHYAFKVVFKGENVEGEGGPYRQFFTDVSKELRDGHLPLLVPCANAQARLGANRDKFVVAASLTHAQALAAFEFLGVLMGCAMRTGVLLPLDVTPLFWKPLVGARVDRSDLAKVDHALYRSLAYLRQCTADDFSGDTRTIFDRFEVAMSDGTVVPLKPGGENIEVTSDNVEEYVRLVERARLHEGSVQLAAIRRGLCKVVPAPLLNVFEWNDLERRVCGAPHIDVHLLRRHTEYCYVEESAPHIGYFWSVLHSMSQEELRRFVRFAYAQERLPADDAEFERAGLRMLIKPYQGSSSNEDAAFPKADTCFFNLMLPAYSSESVMRARLLLAISMDADSMNADAGQGEPLEDYVDDYSEEYSITSSEEEEDGYLEEL